MGLVSSFGASAVGIPGLLLGVWLVAGRATPPARRPHGYGRAVTAGWVLMVTSAALMVLAVPLITGTAAPVPGPGTSGAAAGSSATPARGPAPASVPGGPG